MGALKRVARYLAGTKELVVRLELDRDVKPGHVHLVGWADSDWAGDQATRRSQTSGFITADGIAMRSFSRRQATVATSSAAAELYAMAAVAEELMLFREVVIFFGLEPAAELRSDSSAARGIARREGVGKMKGLEVRTL